MKGGTFSLDIRVPLINPGISMIKQVAPKPIKTAIYPNSGAKDLITVAKITDAKPGYNYKSLSDAN